MMQSVVEMQDRSERAHIMLIPGKDSNARRCPLSFTACRDLTREDERQSEIRPHLVRRSTVQQKVNGPQASVPLEW